MKTEMRRPLVKAAVTTVLLGIAVGAWIVLAPRQLPGGSASYVVPAGSSMLPLLHPDDLVVVREASEYGPGDVIAYDSADLDRIVLHRVVRVEDDRFVTKGDNNDWLDRDRPTADAVLGRMLLRVPGGGTALAWIRTPRNAAVLGTVAAVMVMGGAGFRRRRRRRRRGDPAPSAPRTAGSGVGLRFASTALAGLTLGFGALAAFAHLRSDTRVVPTRVPYQHQGTFEYAAEAERGAVYPDGRVTSGEPVFLRLADRVEVRFGYRFVSDQPHAVTGTVALSADLEDGTGWRRSFALQEPAPFTGDEAAAAGILDLPRIGSLIRQVEKATEIARPTYSLVLRPSVQVEGTLAGRQVRAEHRPELLFEADPLLLRLSDPEDPAEDPLEALSSTGRGSVLVRDELPNPVAIGPVRMEPGTARSVSLIGLGVATLALLIVGLLLLRRNRSEPARILARYGQRIVPVAEGGSTLDGPVVDVATMPALARIADSYERVILHEDRGNTHAYLVEGDVALYRYRVGPAAEPPAEPSRPQPPAATSPVEPPPPVRAPAVIPGPPAAAPMPDPPVHAARPSIPAPEPHPSGNGDDPHWVADEDWWEADADEDAAGSTDPARPPMRPSTLADDFFLSPPG